jgi:hypothetical protein
MKLRQGFVSNSSSTSFSIYGGVISDKDIEDKYGLINELKLVYHQEYQEAHTFVVGRDTADVGDNETGAQFREDVRQKLSKIMPDPKCGYYADGWYDG